MIGRLSQLLAAPALAFARNAGAADAVLRAGDQKGGTPSFMKAAVIRARLEAGRVFTPSFNEVVGG